MLNLDQMLVNNVLSANVSDFQIDWTWADGVGRDLSVRSLDPINGEFLGGLPGVIVDSSQQPWYGLNRSAESNSNTIGQPGYSAFYDENDVYSPIIERTDDTLGAPSGVRRYGAVFGYNQEGGLLLAGDDQPILNSSGQPVFADHVSTASDSNSDPIYLLSYTPWPTALRITMRLHDTKNKLEGGRELQFVFPIPQNENR